MSDETTTSEQLAEIEGQATDYTPPDGWRLLEVGETITLGDEYVESDYRRRYPTKRVGSTVGATELYIRRIERPEPIQVCEGRWETRDGKIRNVTPTPEDFEVDLYPWWDAQYRQTWRANGQHHHSGESMLDLVTYLGSIEEAKTQELPAKTQELPAKTQELPADTADELRSEVSYVQNLLGESRRRVTHLESLVANLRTINAAQEKAVDAAGKENTALQRELAVAKEELTIAAAVSQQLQIELDAAQQVPADLPELRQLRLRLADMTLDRDQYKDAWNQIFTDQTTIRETTAAETVEAIIEWLQHFRGCNSPALALLLLEALPHIMRSLTGLEQD